MNGAVSGIQHGGCSAWALPPDETCARMARSLVRGTLALLRLPDELIEDAVTIVSELSANAFLHGLGGPAPYASGPSGGIGLPELWLYRRDHPTPQLVCKVFDPLRQAHSGDLRAGHPGPLAEHGRGLAIVERLSAQWGVELTRCRLGQWRMPGKAVWAALSLPPSWPCPPLPCLPRADAVAELSAALAERGVQGMRRMQNEHLALVSVRHGLTVWACDTFSWQDRNGTYVEYPFTELVEVTDQVVRRHEELAAQPDGAPRA